jgi:hypothetical protein
MDTIQTEEFRISVDTLQVKKATRMRGKVGCASSMKACRGSRDIAPVIFNLTIRWKLVVNIIA